MFISSFNSKHYHGQTSDNLYVIISCAVVDASFDKWKRESGSKAGALEYSQAVARYYSPDAWSQWHPPPNSFTVLDKFIVVSWTFEPPRRLYTARNYDNKQLISTTRSYDFMTIEQLLQDLKARRVVSQVTDAIGGVYAVQ